MKVRMEYEGKVCALCGKGIQRANLVSHAKNRVKTIRRPNLHVHREKIEGVRVKMLLCAKCKRVMRKNSSEK